MEAFYIQDDYKLTKNMQINGGLALGLPASLSVPTTSLPEAQYFHGQHGTAHRLYLGLHR